MNIFLKAYTKLNFGDDLFIKIILERYPEHQFFIFAHAVYRQIFKDYPNLTVLPPTKFSLIQKLKHKALKSFGHPSYYPQYYEAFFGEIYRHCEAFVSLGGSIFMERTYGEEDHETPFYQHAVKHFHTKGIYFLGCNFGPFHSENFKQAYRKIFTEATDICFRDRPSYELFSDLEHVRYAPDLVFAMDFESAPLPIQKSVGIVPVTDFRLENEDEKERYINQYAALANHLVKQGCHINFYSFCEKEGDLETIKKIVSKIADTPHLFIENYTGNLNEFLRHYAENEILICGRFHAMILGLLLKRKIFCINYSKKMDNVLRDLNVPPEHYMSVQAFLDKETSEISAENLWDYKLDQTISTQAAQQFENLDMRLNHA